MQLLFVLLCLLPPCLSWCEYSKFSLPGNATCVDYSPDYTRMAVTAGGTVYVLEGVRKTLMFSRTGLCARFAGGLDLLAVATTGGRVEVLNGSTFAGLYNISTSYGSFSTMDFLNNNLLTCGDNRILAWSLAVGGATQTYNVSQSSLNGCKWSRASDHIGFYTSNNRVTWAQFTSSTSKNDKSTSNPFTCYDVDFSATYMIAACMQGANRGIVLRLSDWNMQNVAPATNKMNTASFAPDDQTFAYGGDDKKVFIMNGTSNNFSVMSSFLQTSNVVSLAFSYDSNFLLVGTSDGTIYQYARYCLGCNPGWFLNIATQACIRCEVTMPSCSLCTNTTVCLQCYEDFYLDTSVIPSDCKTCRSALPNCQTCSNSSVCVVCENTFYKAANGSCLPCVEAMPGCMYCNSTGYCFQCQSDYYRDSSTFRCVPCTQIANCSKCSTSSKCIQCQTGYYISGSLQCLACSASCYSCISNTNCTSCLKGYYLNPSSLCSACINNCIHCTDANVCIGCADGFYLQGDLCYACVYPCLQCNSSAYCLSCETGHYYIGSGVCRQCDRSCASCNSTTYCIGCRVGNYLTATNTCLECQLSLPNCMQCTASACLKCQLGFYLETSTTCRTCTSIMHACLTCSSATACHSCATGYYLAASPGNNSCGTCPYGCATCVNASACTQCNTGYYLQGVLCNLCENRCLRCTSATACLECEVGFRVSGTGCVTCGVVGCLECVYNYTAGATQCTSCEPGLYRDGAGGCSYCPINCTTCFNGTQCLTCVLGQYLDAGKVCQTCPAACAECLSPTNCTSCTPGYELTAANTCSSCALYNCATCNSTTHECLSCNIGFYRALVATQYTCLSCITAITNCQICTSPAACIQCTYGYVATGASCASCGVLPGCRHCTGLAVCAACEIGYYLVGGGCVGCGGACRECYATGQCRVCVDGYYLGAGAVCQWCDGSMDGCRICVDAGNCTLCHPGYYLEDSICRPCSPALSGCVFCLSALACTHCAPSFFLTPNNTCAPCSSSLAGCQLCNSSSICLACQSGMYRQPNNTCTLCSTTVSECIYCLAANMCQQCNSGYYLSASNASCDDCNVAIPGCLVCDDPTNCLQCQSGYYLDAGSSLCVACSRDGCEICRESDPDQCLVCNSRYYLNVTSSDCLSCGTYNQGCSTCVNSTKCIACEAGYTLNAGYGCTLCSDLMLGCGRCVANGTCLECKASFYLLPSNLCRQCKQAMAGCVSCINGSVCQTCYHGYYPSNLTCRPCTTAPGCLSCLNATYCQYCESGYFLQPLDNVCYSCTVIPGCYSCTDNLTCSLCVSGYTLNSDLICEVVKVQAISRVKEMKLVTRYLNESVLVHYLMVKGMKYRQMAGIDWNATTELGLVDEKFKEMRLSILRVEWGSTGNTLIFYTNNPLNLTQRSFDLVRRVLTTSPIVEKYKVNLKMDQATINTILPQLFLPQNLVVDYDIEQPQFMVSFATSIGDYVLYSIFGYALMGLLLLKYILKAIYSAPQSEEMGDILPQMAAMKAPAFMLYPIHMEYLYYCAGFMVPDLPWLNQFFGRLVSDPSETIPRPFATFYTNLHIGNTYLLALIVIVTMGLVLWIVHRSKQETEQKDKFPIGDVFYNFFVFGAVWAGCLCIQGGFYNLKQTIGMNSAMYMLGIGLYCLVLGFTAYRFIINRDEMSRVRVFLKATCLSLANLSPIYIFSAAVVADVALLVIEHNLTGLKRRFPRIWLAKNLICNLALCLLAFMPTIMLCLILASIALVAVLGLDIYTHVREVLDSRKLSIDLARNTMTSHDSMGSNIWNIRADKQFEQFEVDNKIENSNHDEPNEAVKTSYMGTRTTFVETKKTKMYIPKRRRLKKQPEASQAIENALQVLNFNREESLQQENQWKL